VDVNTYVTSAGDTWDSIAYALWGNEYLMSELQEANPDYLDVLVFESGVRLVVPVVEDPAAEVLPPWKS
jgi:phage tail protein X